MFTGIIEGMATLERIEGMRFVFRSKLATQDAAIGDSISVNGVCLTVVTIEQDTWGIDAVEETLTRTTLSELKIGDKVNFERSVRAADRLGGHIVQGHVDATATVVRPAPDLRIQLSQELMKYVAEKGSICIDGVSLTVVDPFDDGFSVAIIPHTSAVTTLGELKSGDKVNIEIDAMARYAEKMLAYVNRTSASAGSVLDD